MTIWLTETPNSGQAIQLPPRLMSFTATSLGEVLWKDPVEANPTIEDVTKWKPTRPDDSRKKTPFS
ncbi:hypothetical protein N7528_002838 [Penicillium herquei]|nr:hypothetical protein N7528_002838 [Penicillium herquei]